MELKLVVEASLSMFLYRVFLFILFSSAYFNCRKLYHRFISDGINVTEILIVLNIYLHISLKVYSCTKLIKSIGRTESEH